ncbi:uncharacterized protein LOC127241819 isoform X2 [Andrographis paniculata]|nr:uncharacterized protein LOC127241819 isoform X2 [Andrographis paniculata]
MAKGKLILICQSGGKFITNSDGTLSYEAGEANAVNVNHDTLFEDLRLKLAEMSNLDQKTVSIKYFLPGNRRHLITLRNEKDLKRMLGFHENSVTADIFVDGKEGFDHDAAKLESSRDSSVKLAETVNHISIPASASTLVADNVKSPDCHTDASPDDTEPPVCIPADVSSHDQPHSAAPLSEHDTENGADYKPLLFVNSNADQSPGGVDMNGSPADTVKKRRRTASWALGSLGTTIVSVSENDGSKRRRKNNQEDQNDDAVAGTNDLENPSTVSFSADSLPEKLVASWRDCITGVGQDFKSVKEFRQALQKYAIAHRFVYKLKKNDSNRASGICVEEGCSWSIHASWVLASQTFTVKKFNDSHTCGGASWKHAHPAKKLLVSVIKDKLRDSPHHNPKAIAQSISQDFGLELKYTQVRRGIEDAREQLHGSYKESYNRLPWFCRKFVEMNPGSVVNLITNDEKRLRYLFVSFNPFVRSFQTACRPILFLDAVSMKSKYQESLLLALAVDADDRFFPVAFTIVDSENEHSWHWFLEQLKSEVTTPSPITFVSDMEKGLSKSLHEIFPNHYHGYDIYRLTESFKSNLKGPYHGEGRGVLPAKFLAASRAVRHSAFRSSMEQMKQISSNAYDWVNQIEPRSWASFAFCGEQYNHVVQNVAEPYAKRIDEIQDSTITQKIEAVVKMIEEMIIGRRTESSQWTSKLTPTNENKIRAASLKAQGLRVFISSDVLFEVHDDSTHVINIERRECTCLEWKCNGIPCCHAIGAFNYLGKNVYEYCPNYCSVESFCLTYSEPINPVPDFSKEDSDLGEVQVLPPAAVAAPRSTTTTTTQQKKEQTKTTMTAAEDPDKRTVTCSKCKEAGHNKASCKAV